MRFDDLPENWTSLPLDDAPLASGVIDLVIGYRDRQRDTMLILPCDQHDVAVPRPILIGEIDLELLETTRRIWPFLRDRRIDAYGDLPR
ncbi:MAG TPA: hypothetical protein PKC36_15445, partial [Dietzia sp.]|nr:hypothetical protein [Dietzia sp.]